VEEFTSPVADVTETLDNESLVLKASGKTDLLAESGVGKEFSNTEVDTETSRLSSASNTSL
jgi:hypothetical protein